MDMTDESAFLEFKADPAPERLERLLTSVQDRVYNICFQILRRAEDAEDACQEVLLEVARGLHRIDVPRAFKVWLYRVAVHTSLDRKEARDRRARLAPQPKGPAMNDAEREELMRAIRTLDDRTRCLVLEHYFDKATLEEIGAREGISAPAVHKRLERARETLRRALLGAGFTGAAAGVAEGLESITPVCAPAGLAGKALLAGGAVMGTKSAISGGTIVAALILFGATSTGGFLVGNHRSESQIRELNSRVAMAERKLHPASAAVPVKVDPPRPPEETPQLVVEPDMKTTTPTSKPASSRKESSNAGASVEDPNKVFYGRPRKPDLQDLLKIETWDEFYAKSKEMKVGGEMLEDLIFRRLGNELNLDARKLAALRKIFEDERIESTRVIVENTGGKAAFRQRMDDYGGNWNLFHAEWQRLRENVRRGFNDEYLKHLTYDQLTYLNEHLRNGEIQIENYYDNDGAHYLVGGVGKKPR